MENKGLYKQISAENWNKIRENKPDFSNPKDPFWGKLVETIHLLKQLVEKHHGSKD